MTWKDTTSYSRGGARTPTMWSLNVGGIRITVTCNHILYKGQWVMICEPWTGPRELKTTTAEDAQTEALAWVIAKVSALHAALQQAAGT